VETIVSSNPNGVSVAYAYDELNRLSMVVDNRLQGQNTTTYSYDNASNVATVATPNQLTASFTYDSMNRLTAMNAGTASYSYQLGPTGNRTSATEGNGRSLTWNYDGIYRLTSETINSDPANNNGSAAYGLDPVGNRLSANSTLSTLTSGSWTFNANDEQVSSESYDANGNVTSTDGMNYTYDSQNHMLTASGNGKSISMIYDAFGNRVAKTVNGVSTQYLVEDDVNPTGLPQVVEELTGSFGAGVVTRTYTYGLQRISQNLSPAVSGNSTWTPSFYVYDGGGSVRQLTNSNGTVTDEYEYDAYGNSFTKSGTTPNNYLYRGEQYDQDLGLYYLRARYYNPNTGRFMSRDPEDGDETDPKTLHKYVYANGDPVNAVDPTGRMAAEYALPLGIIAIPTTKVLLALGGTVGCLLLWEGGNVWANSVVASNGGYVMQLPCFALPMSKGGKQNVVHQWVLEMAKGMQGDVCAALKQIMSEARKAGDSSLFNAAKATYKATCRGYGG
jgi:RHS repeat-associated protein